MWDNTIGLSKPSGAGSSYLRNRSSLALACTPSDHLTISVKLTNELRYYTVPEVRGFQFDEVFFDQLFIVWSEIFQKPVSLTIGRQNIGFGEGFVLMDGGPLDGSRSAYFNAVRTDWNISEKTTLAAFYFYQPEWDRYMPALNRLKVRLIEQDEEGIGIHCSARYDSGEVQGYLIRKSARSLAAADRTVRIVTPGVRVTGKVSQKLGLYTEAAYQIGDRNSNSAEAYGGYFYGEYSPGVKGYLPEKISLGGLYLSGDDPGTGIDEGWDPLFARWPKWSESYIYAQVPEDGVAYWSNLASVFAKASYTIIPHAVFTVDYHHLMAVEKAAGGSAFPGGAGKRRGELIIGKLVYRANEHLSGHVLVEHFIPGTYYFEGADSYTWIRLETFLNF